MNFSLSAIIAGLLFGTWGMYLIKRAKSEAHWPSLFIGLVLMIYPYLVDNIYLLWGIGISLVALAYQI